jgi:preprotein translocase subunit SecG
MRAFAIILAVAATAACGVALLKRSAGGGRSAVLKSHSEGLFPARSGGSLRRSDTSAIGASGMPGACLNRSN